MLVSKQQPLRRQIPYPIQQSCKRHLVPNDPVSGSLHLLSWSCKIHYSSGSRLTVPVRSYRPKVRVVIEGAEGKSRERILGIDTQSDAPIIPQNFAKTIGLQ